MEMTVSETFRSIEIDRSPLSLSLLSPVVAERLMRARASTWHGRLFVILRQPTNRHTPKRLHGEASFRKAEVAAH
jgi:hypothetical protein